MSQLSDRPDADQPRRQAPAQADQQAQADRSAGATPPPVESWEEMRTS